MSYSDEKMAALTAAIRDLDGLKYQIKKLNENAKSFERLAIAIEEQNRLKQEELKLTFKPKGY
jgi:hypothetical protein